MSSQHLHPMPEIQKRFSAEKPPISVCSKALYESASQLSHHTSIRSYRGLKKIPFEFIIHVFEG